MTSANTGSEGRDPEISARLSLMEERLGALEHAVSALTAARVASPPAAAPPPPAPTARPIEMPPPSAAVYPRRTVSTSGPAALRERTGSPITAETALRWAGVVLVVLAALFFVSTAISRGWIGPKVQLGLATLGGAALIAVGIQIDRLQGEDRRPWALALANAGVVVLGLCAGAAHAWLDLVEVGPSSALIVAVLTLALGLAHRFAHQSLVMVGLATALVVPGLIEAYDAFGQLGTGAWFLSLVVVTIGVAVQYGWSIPRLVGLVVIGPLMVALTQGFADRPDVSLPVVQAMIAVAGLLWWLAPWIRPADERLRSLDHRLAFVVPGLVAAASFGLWATTNRERAVVAAVVAMGAAVVTAAVWYRGRSGSSVPSLSQDLLVGHVVGVGALVSVALALWFEGPALLSALTFQALGTLLLALRRNDRFLEENAALLGAVVGVWTAGGLLDGIESGLRSSEAVAYLLVIAAGGVAAWLVRHRSAQVAVVVAVSGWVGLLAWLMAVLRPIAQGQMIVSITWALLGVALVVIGLGLVPIGGRGRAGTSARWRDQIKTAGLATLAATVVKLVTVDLAEVDTIWRALLFALIGVGLLRLGYSMGLLERRGEADQRPETNGFSAEDSPSVP